MAWTSEHRCLEVISSLKLENNLALQMNMLAPNKPILLFTALIINHKF